MQSETSRPVLLVRSGGDKAVPEWQQAFGAVLPDVDVRGWNDPDVAPKDVWYVLVWEPELGRLATYPNLRVIFSSAAGVDRITRDLARPPHVPIVRMGADEMAQTVGEYVCLAVLGILRDMPRMFRAHAAGVWDNFEPPRTAQGTRVGIMGMGQIGTVAARMLQGIGFAVHGWSRSARHVDGVRGYAGADALADFLAISDILVSILPDTPQTAGLLDAARLTALPRGAGLVNAGRGSLIVMPDLLAALDSGQISTAILDVFPVEPLPPDDPCWRHERLLVTPHLAGFASRAARAAWVAHCVRANRAGEPMGNVFDPSRGY